MSGSGVEGLPSGPDAAPQAPALRQPVTIVLSARRPRHHEQKRRRARPRPRAAVADIEGPLPVLLESEWPGRTRAGVSGDRAAARPGGAAGGRLRAGVTVGEDVVDVATWAGSVPAVTGVTPRVRVGRRWFNLLWLLPIGFVVLLVCGGRGAGAAADPGGGRVHRRAIPAPPSDGPTDTVGIPVWARWQHFFNLFLLIFILRSGLQILSDHPRLYWTRHCTPGRDWFRVQKPVPPDPLWTAKQDSISLPGQVGLPGLRHSIGLARWWHLGMDTLWLLNGLVFYILLFTTGHWRRLVPTSLDVFPQAASAADPVPLACLARRQRLGRLQRAAAARLLHHRVRRRPARGAVPGWACPRRCPTGSPRSALCSAFRSPGRCTSWCGCGSSGSSSSTSPWSPPPALWPTSTTSPPAATTPPGGGSGCSSPGWPWSS